jgi:hypothetical protein
MSVEKKKITVGTGPMGMVMFDPNLLHSGYARKLYAFTNPDFKRRTEAHVHDSPHMISVIEGDCLRLAVKESDGTITITKLERGYYYYIPANVPHQFCMKGRTIAESYSPSASIISALQSDEHAKKVLDEDLFEMAERREKAVVV